MQFASIYRAHAAFTAAVTPPMVVALLLAVFWRRFTRTAALWTLAGGLVLMAASMLLPALIKPFAHGVAGGDIAWDFLAGMREQEFMRACFGVVCCAAIAVVVTLLTRPEPVEKQRGLVWGTIRDALRHYKGSPGRESDVTRALALPEQLPQRLPHFGTAELEGVRISAALARSLDAQVGDLLYVTDARWWTGGLHSAHVIVAEISPQPTGEPTVALDDTAFRNIVGKRLDRPVRVERLYASGSSAENHAA